MFAVFFVTFSYQFRISSFSLTSSDTFSLSCLFSSKAFNTSKDERLTKKIFQLIPVWKFQYVSMISKTLWDDTAKLEVVPS